MSMSMSRPPLSPLSMSSNESAGVLGRYAGPGPNGMPMGTPNDIPYGNSGPYAATRPFQTSPPGSMHPSSESSRPSGSGSSNRPPSSASSANMSSDGRRGPINRDSSRSQIRPEGEEALQKHYFALKQYLQQLLQDEKGMMKPNRARDKLLRLSVTQFMELSTDVYDELIRREDERTSRVDNVPRFLLPKQNYHPKRNQARQKLSTLPIERFRQLATDVFYELERRIPRFVGADRPGSSMSNSSRGGMRPPPFGPGFGRGRGAGPMSPYFPPGSPGMPPNGRRPSEAAQLGRPLPKTFQSSTMVPNKSTMVEDDEDDEYGLNGGMMNDEERAKMEQEILTLKERIAELEAKQAGPGIEEERGQWTALREELEQKAVDAQKLNENLQKDIAALRQQTSGGGSGDSLARIAALEEEISKQETMMNEVRADATLYLKEMRTLAAQNDAAIEQEEMLAKRVAELQKENHEWRQRYARLKSQNKSLRASTMGLGMHSSTKRNSKFRSGANAFDERDAGSLVREEGLISEGGLVRDTDITQYQLAIDDLLRVARGTDSGAMLDSVKSVVVCVSAITAGVGTDGYPTPSPSPLGPDSNLTSSAPSVSKIKARVTGTANSLITATKQHAAAHGLSPVALLDAAMSNLTSAIVQLIKAVKIRPSSGSELREYESTAAASEDLANFYSQEIEDSSNNSSSAHLNPPKSANSITANHTQPSPTPSASKKVSNGWFAWGKWGDANGQGGGETDSASSAEGNPHDGIVDDEYDDPTAMYNTGNDHHHHQYSHPHQQQQHGGDDDGEGYHGLGLLNTAAGSSTQHDGHAMEVSTPTVTTPLEHQHRDDYLLPSAHYEGRTSRSSRASSRGSSQYQGYGR